MESFLALIVICLVALLCVKLGSTTLQLTGMSFPVAQFQASSVFFGAGLMKRLVHPGGASDKDTKVHFGDVLMVYGRDEDVRRVLN